MTVGLKKTGQHPSSDTHGASVKVDLPWLQSDPLKRQWRKMVGMHTAIDDRPKTYRFNPGFTTSCLYRGPESEHLAKAFADGRPVLAVYSDYRPLTGNSPCAYATGEDIDAILWVIIDRVETPYGDLDSDRPLSIIGHEIALAPIR